MQPHRDSLSALLILDLRAISRALFFGCTCWRVGGGGDCEQVQGLGLQVGEFNVEGLNDLVLVA